MHIRSCEKFPEEIPMCLEMAVLNIHIPTFQWKLPGDTAQTASLTTINLSINLIWSPHRPVSLGSGKICIKYMLVLWLCPQQIFLSDRRLPSHFPFPFLFPFPLPLPIPFLLPQLFGCTCLNYIQAYLNLFR